MLQKVLLFPKMIGNCPTTTFEISSNHSKAKFAHWSLKKSLVQQLFLNGKYQRMMVTVKWLDIKSKNETKNQVQMASGMLHSIKSDIVKQMFKT